MARSDARHAAPDQSAQGAAVTSRTHPFTQLEPFKDDDTLHVIIETPKGSRNKFKFDPSRGLFELGSVLPAGAVFPFDFGFVPGTKADDGDPMDVLVLMDEPAFPGCLIRSRLIGVIEAHQVERDGTETENHRLIAVATNSWAHHDVTTIEDVGERVIEEIEHFFVSYNAAKYKTFSPRGRHGAKRARRIVEDAIVTKKKKGTKKKEE
jgi:inorganic pyrophosphatase